MVPVYLTPSSAAWTDINCMFWRTYAIAGPAWRLSLDIRMVHGAHASHPSAKAVVDDFGTLVIIGGWE